MQQSFLLEHSGPFVIFGDFLYPAHSDDSENYVLRPTVSGRGSKLGLRDPIPLVDLEGDDAFAKADQITAYQDSLLLSAASTTLPTAEYRDRLSTLQFIVGGVMPMLAGRREGEGLTGEAIVAEVLKESELSDKLIDEGAALELLQKLELEGAEPYFDNLPENEVLALAFPTAAKGSFSHGDTSVLARTLNYNALYVNHGFAHVLRAGERDGFDTVHMHGRNFSWSRRYELSWIDERYIEMLRQGWNAGLRERIGQMIETEKRVDEGKQSYARLVGLDSFEFRNLVVRWFGRKCYLTRKRGPFARQDVEVWNKWHKRGPFEIGGSFYYSDGELYFGESPVVRADYKDIGFFGGEKGIFRVLCSQEKDQWLKFPRTPQGAARYVDSAQNIFYNGFPPENIRRHTWGFGDAWTYRELFPLDKAITANSPREVREQHGCDPVNIYLEMKG